MSKYKCDLCNGITEEETTIIIESADPSLIEDEIHCAMETQGFIRPWFLVNYKKVGRGGARKGAGTKSPEKGGRKKGSGKWGDEETVVKRVPISVAKKIEALHEALETIETIIKLREAEAQRAKEESITKKFPRTYDKARELIKELKEELNIH